MSGETMSRTSSLGIVRKLTSAPLDVEVHLGRVLEGVRDHVMDWVLRNYERAVWAEPFLRHLSKIGRFALDPYSELEFILEAYSVRLVFVTLTYATSVLCYRVPDLSLDPDPRLARRRGVLGWLLD